MNTISASNATARPAAKRSLRLLAGLTLATSSLIGALSTNASATEASAPAPTAAASATVQAPTGARPVAATTAPTVNDRNSIGAAPGTEANERAGRAVYQYRWGYRLWDPTSAYYHYYRNACARSVYPSSGIFQATASGGYRIYRCWKRIA